MSLSKKIKLDNEEFKDLSDTAFKFLQLEKSLCSSLLNIKYNPCVAYIYNPLEYAYELHEDYLRKYCTGPKKVLLLGMNPGPWGMAQTGVPFGHVNSVKTWLQIRGNVSKPKHEHPKRPIMGLDCERSEVSGERMWNLLRELSGSPQNLFKNIFLHNICPLIFMKDSAKNITPPELKAEERKLLEKLCLESLAETLKLFKVEHVIGIGQYAAGKAKKAILDYKIEDVKVTSIMHPSPINPAANRGWKECIIKQLKEENLLCYFQ